jgi:uncharacterized membrane protein (DUF4010 family)
MTADFSQQAVALAAALGAGLLVGLERGWRQRDRPDGSRAAGFRTFGLLGLAGGLAGLLPDALAAVVALVAGLVVVAGYRAEAEGPSRSATTAVAGLLTIAIGIVATRIGPGLALGAAAACFALLNARATLHGLLRGMGEEEIDAVARFLLVALVVLPLLPDAQYGPYDAWNPRRIWLVVVLVAGLSFAGYAASRRWGGERGLLVVAASGALVSSTAVTVDYARRMRAEPERQGALVAGIALASVVMFLRVQAITLALAPMALPALALALAPATVVAVVFAALACRRQHGMPAAAVKLGNPLDFRPALGLAAMVAVLSVAARWALATFGGNGMATVLALTGMMDVDAAVITLAGLPPGAVDPGLAGLLLAGPVLANTLVKAGMAMVLAPGRAGLKAALPLLASFAASALAVGLWMLQRTML